MKFSIIIGTYNDDLRLRNTLYGWAGQPFKDFEVVVVNDGGDTLGNLDPTKDLVESFSKYMRVKYLYYGTPKNGKQIFQPAATRNAGIKAASGYYCVISDCDVIPSVGLLTTLDKVCNEKRLVVGVRSHIAKDKIESITIANFTDLDGLAYTQDFRLKAPIRDKFLSFKDSHSPETWPLVWSCIIATPLYIVKEIGGFDERFKSWGGEDEDFGERLIRGKGLGFYSCTEAQMYHQDHPPRCPAKYQALDHLAEIRRNWTIVRNGGPL